MEDSKEILKLETFNNIYFTIHPLAQEKSHVVTLESELQTSMKKSEELLMQNESFRKRASEINSNLSSIKSEKELISRATIAVQRRES